MPLKSPGRSDRSAELLVLGLLARESLHAYAIQEFLELSLQFVTSLNKATAYRMLDRMREQGWVDATVERLGRYPERTVYHITAAGRARFEALLREQLPAPARLSDPGSIPLLFLDDLSDDERSSLLRQRGDELQALAQSLAAVQQQHGEATPAHAVLRLHIDWIEAERRWIDEHAVHVESRHPSNSDGATRVS